MECPGFGQRHIRNHHKASTSIPLEVVLHFPPSGLFLPPYWAQESAATSIPACNEEFMENFQNAVLPSVWSSFQLRKAKEKLMGEKNRVGVCGIWHLHCFSSF